MLESLTMTEQGTMLTSSAMVCTPSDVSNLISFINACSSSHFCRIELMTQTDVECPSHYFFYRAWVQGQDIPRQT